MKIETLIHGSQKPDLYEKGSAIMWTDSYISEQLLLPRRCLCRDVV